MVSAIAFLLVCCAWWWTHRNRYWWLETKTTGRIKSLIVHLPLQHITHVKLRREIKIFNRLCLVLPTVDRVAVVYREQLKALLRNAQHKPSNDPYERLFYGYACYVLLQKLNDEVIKRQLQRNLIFLFAPQHKFVKRTPLTLTRHNNLFHVEPVYKIFNDSYLQLHQPALTMSKPWCVITHGSYVKYYNEDVVVRRYAHAYTLDTETTQTVTLKVAVDKTDFDCQINRGVITCRHLPTGEIHTYAVRGEQVLLATSMCAKTDALEIYLTWQGHAQISLDGGQPKWLPVADVVANRRIERLVNMAYQSKFIKGEKLRKRYSVVKKLIPSFDCLTRVVAIHHEEEFLQVWNQLADYRQVAKLFGGFNLIFLYSSTVPALAEIMLATISNEQMVACHDDQLWLYLVDRTVTDPDALYFLHKMTQVSHYVAPAITPPGLIVTRNWPYVKTLTVTNTLSQNMTRDLVVPLHFNHLSVVNANGTLLTVTGLVSGRMSTYVLPAPIHLAGEWLTTHVNLPLKIKLAGYETRQFMITRRETQTKNRLTKKDLATAISEIQIRTDDKKFDGVFMKAVIDGEDAKVLAAVKVAYQNQDRKLLLTALAERHQITMDVWQYILTQIVGLRVRTGKIYLTPCVNIMGEFTINFICEGHQYTFNTKKNLPSNRDFATINYGNSK